MNACRCCGKDAPEHHNFCSWDCHIDFAKKEGGQMYTPNGLPIGCIRYDGTMLECEHGDHPTYVFPVDAEYTGDKKDVTVAGLAFDREVHALVYTDGCIALTLYECSYFLWRLRDGKCLHGIHASNKWKLADKSLAKIHALPVKLPTA